MADFDLDPDAVLDVSFDWKPLTHGRPEATSDWLTEGETIQTATVTAETGVTVRANSVTVADGIVTAWLLDGVLGSTVRVTNHIVTNQGREDDRSLDVYVKDR